MRLLNENTRFRNTPFSRACSGVHSLEQTSENSAIAHHLIKGKCTLNSSPALKWSAPDSVQPPAIVYFSP
jgi:hypothetical protein